MGLLGRAGCNVGGCHGSFQGRGAFACRSSALSPTRIFSL
jgi:hypothetical protein